MIPSAFRSFRCSLVPVSLVLGIAALGAGPLSTPAARAQTAPSGTDIMSRMNQAFYYPGNSFRTSVRMELGGPGTAGRERIMSLLRLNTGGKGEQRYLLYFHKPGDVRRMSCMVWKHVDLPDERWMFVPITGQVVKVLAPERSSFIGSDFMREDLSGRDVDADRHTLVREEKQDGRDCYVVESLPRKPVDFSKYVTWVDRETSLPLRQEYYDNRGKLGRVFTGTQIERVASAKNPSVAYPTIMDRTMKSMSSGRWTRVIFSEAVYDPPLQPGDFSADRMRTPIGDWLPAQGKAVSSARTGSAGAPEVAERRTPRANPP
ncbi:MAG TPA: outer membrane lipoprotein-sorting protein [Candidatus Omnitrophota bacterium]|nr:outer membrane lipoprotein-sorting protein [Candidatus Omnitrophota bacterium]